MTEAEYQEKISRLENENSLLRYYMEDMSNDLRALQKFPAIRPMTGEPAKANFYATQSSLALLDKLSEEVANCYGFKKSIAAAFIIEEGIARLGEIPEELKEKAPKTANKSTNNDTQSD